MAAQTPTEPRTHNEYAVGWVCALSKEQTAATAMLDQRHANLSKPSNDPNTYTLGSIGKHNIVIACLPKDRVGTSQAATVVTWMVSTFPSIKIGLMVGIGGGIPPKIRLGDIVVSTPIAQFPGVVQWDSGKAKEGADFERTGSLNNPPTSLLTALTKLETEHELSGSKVPEYLDELKQKWPRLVPRYLRSDSLEDVLFEADYCHVSERINLEVDDGDEEEESCRLCDRTKVAKRKPRDMRVHYGLIASGNQLIKDADFRDKLNKNLGGHILCVEMEAAGLMNDFPCIVIRGICDYADSHKNDDWQEHAAATAAAFAKELLEYVQSSDIDGERTAKDILSQVLDGLSGIGRDVSKMRATMNVDQSTKEKAEILNWLTPVDHAPQQSDFMSMRQEGTGQWLLDSDEFQWWVNQNKATLFGPGIPGAGKTIITSVVVEHLRTKFQNDGSVGIAYLYCNFRRQQEQKPTNLLASILKQLIQRRLSVPENIASLYKHHKEAQNRPSFDEISEVLQSVIANYSRTYIIIDALDECQVSGRSLLLSEIFNLQTKTDVNFFATSRFIPEIVNMFEGSTSLEIYASDEDVARYLDGHMSRLPSFVSRNCALQEEIKTEIIDVVDGMFLLAQLHLDSLIDKTTAREIRRALEELPKGSDALVQAYQGAIFRIQGQEEGFQKLSKRILLWITCAKRPLTILELEHALAVEVGDLELGEDNLPDIKEMAWVCVGLVTIDEESDIIRLVHYTTQQFLETHISWLNIQTDIAITNVHNDIAMAYAQKNIAIICVTYLLFDTFETGFCGTDEDFEARLQQSPLYDYAARNWGYHARAAEAEAEQLKLGQLRQLILKLLKSEYKVSSCSQAMLASVNSFNYSQRVPKQMTGLHLAAYFGVTEAAQFLIDRDRPDPEDSYGHTPLWWAAMNRNDAVVKLLLDKGADLETKDKIYSQTLLSLVAANGHEAMVKLLLDKGAELETRDKRYGQTPLSWAAVNGHEAVAKLLLDKGAELETKGLHFGQTPLSGAVENGHQAVVKLMLDKGAKLESKGNEGWTPLCWAAKKGYTAVVNLLLDKGAELETKDIYGQTPLSLAATNGHEAMVKLLLDKGAELETRDKRYGRTPLSSAAVYRHEAVVKLLLDEGADLETKDKNYGRTPLSWAAVGGHEAMVNMLLDKGAELETKDKDYGWTPLSLAAAKGHETVVNMLLDKGSELETKDKDYGLTPLSLAAAKGHETVVNLLLDKGAELETKDMCYGRTPLSWAAVNGHESMVNLLLDKGAELETIDKLGRTPLLLAAVKGYEAVAKLLLDKGAELETKDEEYGWTPLSWAAANGHEAVVKLLLGNGAELETKDNNCGRTPLLLAAAKGYETVAKLLLDKGAELETKDTRYCQTPLLYAAENGNEAVVELLLNKGAEVGVENRSGWTALQLATLNRHEGVEQLLVMHGSSMPEDFYGLQKLFF